MAIGNRQLEITFAGMNFSSRTIPFAATAQFSKLFLDYVSGAEQLRAFFPYSATDAGYKAAVEKLNYKESNRAVLVEVMREQYQTSGLVPNEKLLSQLAQPGAMAVCTGHQLCLFTGPLYFIYKIITCIRVAEEQSKKLNRPVVPVYWMASEDHDFAEISSVNVFGKTLKWETEASGAVGHLHTDSLAPLLAELKTLMGENEAADKLFAQLSIAYRPGRTLAQATREFVQQLFGEKVLILDADDARLKKLFAPVFLDELTKQSSEKLVNASIAALAALGYASQVNPRKINVFYMKENLRERIEPDGENYKVLNTALSFSKEEILAELENHPEYFSPNVVLRPLYQQVIMPNISYVGGPGEIAYWLEYKTMFEHFNITFPVLQPRHFALISDKASEEKLAKLQLSLADLFGDLEELLKEMVRKISGNSLSLEAEKESLRALFNSIREKVVPVDITLKGNVEAELQKQLNALENLEGKVMRAAKQKQETSLNQVRKLREKILPDGTLQERYENFIPFALKYEGFIDALEKVFTLPVENLLVLSE